MKRIQIIFLFLIILTVLTVLTNREDSNYYSEYDTRFTCGIKYDFGLLEIVHELKQDSSQKELSLYSIQNAVTTNNPQKIVKNLSVRNNNIPTLKTFYTTPQNNLTALNQAGLSPSRAPPLYS